MKTFRNTEYFSHKHAMKRLSKPDTTVFSAGPLPFFPWILADLRKLKEDIKSMADQT